MIKKFINKIILGDCLEVMKEIPNNSIDTIITDPPYGLGFMNSEWDTFDKTQFGIKGNEGKNDLKVKKNFNILPRYKTDGLYEFTLNWSKEALRIAKPGATMLCFGGSRTQHKITSGIEDAGWIIKDCIMWIYGSGFPKATDISQMLDKDECRKQLTEKLGRKPTKEEFEKGWKEFRKVIGKDKGHTGRKVKNHQGNFDDDNYEWSGEFNITKPSTPEAKLWDGWHSCGLKPAYEPILVAMKPNEGSYAENALNWGVSGLNIDGGRIEFQNEVDEKESKGKNQHSKYPKSIMRNPAPHGIYHQDKRPPEDYTAKGRFPSNIILECTCDEIKEGKDEKVSIHDAPKGTFAGGEQNRGSIKNYRERNVGKVIIHTNPECPCYMLDKQSGETTKGHWVKSKVSGYGKFGGGKQEYFGKGEYAQDKGGASRFFYTAKASKSERNLGCDGLKKKYKRRDDGQPYGMNTNKFRPNGTERKEVKPQTNSHPTVKPLKLMEYLCILTKTPMPNGGIVLDPFAGSGTTLMACKKTGRDYIGIEKESEYIKIAEARIKAVKRQLELF